MAYAAVISLMQTMERLSILSQSKNLLSQSETIYIDGEIPNLNSFLETIEHLPTVKIFDAASERRVIDAVQKFEDLIDSHLSDQLSECSSCSTDDHQISFSLLFSEQLPKVKEELSSFLTTLSNITDEQKQQQQRYCFASSDYNTVNQQQNLLVGLDDQIKRLKEWILHPESSLLFTSVVGMTGIGKTTLVEKVFSDPSVVEEFETRLFVHIGPRYNRSEEIMWLVLYQLGITSDKFLKRDYVKQLSETLSDKKYLIVLEDVWAGLHAWHDLEYGGFPVNGKGSRVIIISQIDRYVVSSVVVLPLLKDNESWKLLRQTAFSGSEDKCSRELEKIGKTIAKNCEGLPAAIIQVGENLRGKSFQEWKTLSEKEDPLVITKDDDTPLSEALYFSYMMLSQRLKLCFLYMGVFPKNYVISRSKLIKLWVCESFVPDLSRLFSTPEEIAGGNIDQLIHQSVVLKEKSTALNLYNAKTCRLHFTFRSLCVNEAKSEKFFHILKKYSDCKPHNIRSHKRLCAHNNVVLAFAQVQEWMESVLDVRSLLCLGPNQQYPIVLPLHFRLLKVLDALAIRFYEFPHQILGLLHLTYLSITCDRELPNSISRLWNLEVLIFRRHHKIKLSINCPVYLPIDIWNMHRLTQLYCKGFDLPAPPLDDSHLENLKTLSGVSIHSCTREVLSRIPKLTRLAVHIESAHGATENFSFFDHISTLHEGLESFKCVVVNPNLSSQVVPCFQSFPKYVRKMILSGCQFKWKNMGAIAAFEGLQVLKLRWYAVSGPVWKMNAKQFPSLMFLLLEDLDIEHWESDGERFPYLGHVIFSHCYKLKSIPDQLKHVKRIEVDDCSLSLEKQMCEW